MSTEAEKTLVLRCVEGCVMSGGTDHEEVLEGHTRVLSARDPWGLPTSGSRKLFLYTSHRRVGSRGVWEGWGLNGVAAPVSGVRESRVHSSCVECGSSLRTTGGVRDSHALGEVRGLIPRSVIELS